MPDDAERNMKRSADSPRDTTTGAARQLLPRNHTVPGECGIRQSATMAVHSDCVVIAGRGQEQPCTVRPVVVYRRTSGTQFIYRLQLWQSVIRCRFDPCPPSATAIQFGGIINPARRSLTRLLRQRPFTTVPHFYCLHFIVEELSRPRLPAVKQQPW